MDTRVVSSSKESYATDKLTDDVKAEMKKLLWADAVIFQFPLSGGFQCQLF
jgi:NAD(P)H dehydrogenase (quinone)